MASLNFPNSPSDGDSFSFTNLIGETTQYLYDSDRTLWYINASGTVGPPGPTGATGATGATGPAVTSLVGNDQTTAYTLVASDAGKYVSITTGGVTAPASVFSAGEPVTIYNNSGSDQTITQGSGLTLYSAGTSDTGNRTLAQRGVATILYLSASEAVIGGSGLT